MWLCFVGPRAISLKIQKEEQGTINPEGYYSVSDVGCQYTSSWLFSSMILPAVRANLHASHCLSFHPGSTASDLAVGRCAAGSLWGSADLTEQLNHFQGVCSTHPGAMTVIWAFSKRRGRILWWEGRRERRHSLLSIARAASGWKQWIKGRVVTLLIGFFWKYSHGPQQCFPLKYVSLTLLVHHHYNTADSGGWQHIKALFKGDASFVQSHFKMCWDLSSCSGWAVGNQDYNWTDGL